jgi:hypothetical protein
VSIPDEGSRPNPDVPVVGDPRVWFSAIADGIAIPSSIALVGEPDSSGFQQAAVSVSKVVWQTSFLGEDENPIPGALEEPILVMGERTIWLEVIDAVNMGARVPLAVDFLEGGYVSKDADYSLVYAMDANPNSPQIMSATGTEDTAQFNAFLTWSGNPMQDSDPLDLITQWNIEMDAPPAAFPVLGPLSLSYDSWEREIRGWDYPTPGTAKWWLKAPPQCRSIFDAPATALNGIPTGEVWMEVPEGWRTISDAVICLSTSVASMGCGDSFATSSAWPYIHWDETFAFSGEPIRIQVALLKADAVSWTERVTIGEIPAEYLVPNPATALARGHIGVTLLTTATHPAWSSYQEVKDHVTSGGSSLATSRLLSAEENRQLLNSVPPANVEFVCDSGATSCP